MTTWIEDWFGSEYYSILYKHRDSEEAELFLNNLLPYLKIYPGSNLLDCGCGKGRHSLCLSKKGYKVTGIDVSAKNIEAAKKNEIPNLEFYTHDMRNLFRINYYHAALCLFTSFGYFESDTENSKTIKSMSASIRENGYFVLDFMNATKEMESLVSNEKIKIDGVQFEIKRSVNNNFIEKNILVSDKGKHFSFKESVRMYKEDDFKYIFNKNKMAIVHLFGDYHLHPFNEVTSDRLIVVGKKKA